MLANHVVRQPNCTLITMDHNAPTEDQTKRSFMETFILEGKSCTQVLKLEMNVHDFDLEYGGMSNKRQGIMHNIKMEQGFTLLGTTCEYGDIHSSTRPCVEMLGSRPLVSAYWRWKTCWLPSSLAKSSPRIIRVNNTLGPGVTFKDIVLHLYGTIDTAWGDRLYHLFLGGRHPCTVHEGPD